MRMIAVALLLGCAGSRQRPPEPPPPAVAQPSAVSSPETEWGDFQPEPPREMLLPWTLITDGPPPDPSVIPYRPREPAPRCSEEPEPTTVLRGGHPGYSPSLALSFLRDELPRAEVESPLWSQHWGGCDQVAFSICSRLPLRNRIEHNVCNQVFQSSCFYSRWEGEAFWEIPYQAQEACICSIATVGDPPMARSMPVVDLGMYLGSECGSAILDVLRLL